MDKVRRLEMVVRAADLGGFAAAGQVHECHAIGGEPWHRRNLSGRFGFRSFNQSTRQIQLTEEGRELYHRALDVLERLLPSK